MKARIAVLLLTMLGLTWSNAEEKIPIVIVLEMPPKGSEHKSIWKIDGKEVNGNELSLALNNLLLERGRNYSVIVMFQNDVPYSEVGNMTGILGMVGFTKIKYFLFDESKRLMSEIIMSKKAIPFSEKGEGVVFDD